LRLSEIPAAQILDHMADERIARHLPLMRAPWDIETVRAFVAAKEECWRRDGLGHWAIMIDGRYAGRNQFSGVTDPNSGGSLAALQAGVAARFFHELVLSAGIQVPVWDGLNGEQAEQESLRLALAYDF